MTHAGRVVALKVAGRDNEGEAWKAYQNLKIAAADDATPQAKVDQWLDRCTLRGVAAKTVADYGRCLKWLTDSFPGLALADLDADQVSFLAGRQGWSDSHRANVLAVSQSFLRWATGKMVKLRVPSKPSRGEEMVIAPAVWAAVMRDVRGDFHQLLRVLWETGARPSEIAGLTVEMVRWDTRTATLREHKTARHGRKRILMFNHEAMDALRWQRERYSAGLLFRGQRGERFTAHAIGVRFGRISERIGRKVTAYGIRHTWATRALTQGLPDTHVAAVLGHADTKMIHRHYSHVAADSRLLLSVVDSVK